MEIADLEELGNRYQGVTVDFDSLYDVIELLQISLEVRRLEETGGDWDVRLLAGRLEHAVLPLLSVHFAIPALDRG